MIRGREAVRSCSDLTKSLINAARYCRRQIEAARCWLGDHWKRDAVLRTEGAIHPRMDRFWHAAEFLPKQQVVTALEVCFPVRLGAMSREQPEALGALRLQVRLPRCMFDAVDMLPVIEPRTTARLLVHVESDRMDDVQATVGRHGCSADVACVLRNLWLVQNDVEERFLHKRCSVRAAMCAPSCHVRSDAALSSRHGIGSSVKCHLDGVPRRLVRAVLHASQG